MRLVSLGILIHLTFVQELFAEMTHLPSLIGGASVGIVNGRTAADEEFPNIVKLTTSLGNCTGTVINSCVLTAKHCFASDSSGVKYNGTRVIQQVDGRNYEMQARKKDLGHPDVLGIAPVLVTTAPNRDLAIFKTVEPPLSTYGVDILGEGALPNVGKVTVQKNPGSDGFRTQFQINKTIEATVVGFGRIGNEVPTRPHDKRIGTMNLVGSYSAVHEGEPLDDAPGTKDLIVTAASPSFLDKGDSGGPLFLKDSSGNLMLYGIARATLRTQGDAGSLYTPVAKNMTWIKRTLKKLGCE